ncbi:MAG: cupin domain-containing protein [Sedimentisphaerales bacterium]|nr:cupin domain-containing protein [Sedimentisphaerales bacterium]
MASSEEVLVLDLDNQAGYQRLLAGAPQTHGMKSGRVCLGAGNECGQHSTKGHEELLVFLAGRGELQIDDSDGLPVGVGKVAYIPPHTVHNVRNTGADPLVYIFCVAPASSD